jgi:hypothetical protein
MPSRYPDDHTYRWMLGMFILMVLLQGGLIAWGFVE